MLNVNKNEGWVWTAGSTVGTYYRVMPLSLLQNVVSVGNKQDLPPKKGIWMVVHVELCLMGINATLAFELSAHKWDNSCPPWHWRGCEFEKGRWVWKRIFYVFNPSDHKVFISIQSVLYKLRHIKGVWILLVYLFVMGRLLTCSCRCTNNLFWLSLMFLSSCSKCSECSRPFNTTFTPLSQVYRDLLHLHCSDK